MNSGMGGTLIQHDRTQRDFRLLRLHAKDHELLARQSLLKAHLIKFVFLPGQTDALIALINELRAGARVAMTPDGPRGPARKMQAGALVAAQRSGMPIVPIIAVGERAWAGRQFPRKRPLLTARRDGRVGPDSAIGVGRVGACRMAAC